MKNKNDKQKSIGNSSTLRTKPKKKSEISQMIKDARMSKSNYLNYGQLGHFASKCSNKTAYYDTYRNMMKSKATLKDEGKGKGNAKEKKISNTIIESVIAAVAGEH